MIIQHVARYLRYSQFEVLDHIHDQTRELSESKSSGGGNVAFNIMMVLLCISSASIACGLTQGLLSLNPLEMHVKMRSGSLEEKEQAARVLPIINQHHLLLVTLMLFNATANEAMPLFLDQLVPTYITIIMSVSLVLLFGEIIPSAIFTGPSQLKIASFLAPFTWFIIFILYPIAYPLSKILDVWLGHDDGMTIFNRKEIYTMMQIQQEEGPKRGIHVHNTVINEEVTMIGGALALRDKMVEEVMTRDVFMLSINEKLTIKTLWKIFHSGCSRIPIYEVDRNDVVSVILVKDLLFIDPDDEVPIRNFVALFGRPMQAVWPDQKLHEVLKLFRKSHAHMAIVRDVNSDGQHDPFYETRGIITMEDIFEEIIGDEIMDETEANEDIYARLKGFNPNIDFAQLKHFQSTSSYNSNNPHITSSSDMMLKLNDEEVKSIVTFLNSQVPQITSLFGENNMVMIEELVKTSQVMYIKNDALSLSHHDDEHHTHDDVMIHDDHQLHDLLSFHQEVDMIPHQDHVDDGSNVTTSSSNDDKIQDINIIHVQEDHHHDAHNLDAHHHDHDYHDTPREYLYKRDKVANACTLIMQGTLKVIAGKEGFEIERGPWSMLGADILLEEDGAYVSDFSAYISSSEFRCLRILKPAVMKMTLAYDAQHHPTRMISGKDVKRRTNLSISSASSSSLMHELDASSSSVKPKKDKSLAVTIVGDHHASTATYNPMQSTSSSSNKVSSSVRTSSPDDKKTKQYQMQMKMDEYRAPGLQPHIGFNINHPTRMVHKSPVISSSKSMIPSSSSQSMISSSKSSSSSPSKQGYVPVHNDNPASLLIAKPRTSAHDRSYESIPDDVIRNPLLLPKPSSSSSSLSPDHHV